jgi:hypothetical protein
MALVERIKGICLKPATEWQVIEAEPATTGQLIAGYAAPLAAITPVASLIGGVVLGRTIPFIGTYHVPVVTGVVTAVVTYALALVGVFVLSMIINGLAPSFGGRKDSVAALKVAVYAYTPAWVAGALTIFTALGLLVLIAALYGIYVLYLGLPVLMKSPRERAAAYTGVVVVCAIVIGVLMGLVAGAVGGAGIMGARHAGLGNLSSEPFASPQAHVQFDKDSPLGRLQAMGEAMKESNRRMEEAQKSGDPNAQAQAAMQGLGALLGGGKHVDPVGIDVLKPFVPDTFAGLAKTGSSAEKNGMAGLAVSKAEGRYGDGAQKHVTLEISDTGGISGLVGMAGWMNLQGEREDDQGFERTQKVDGRLVHERGSKVPNGSTEFTVVLGNRFIVEAKGRGVDLPQLKSAVASLDLGKLEGMKDVGVQK